MPTIDVTLPNVLGLHTRAAAKLVDCACLFQAEIRLVLGQKNADAKRIMEVLLLGAKQGDCIQLHVVGEDAEEAMTACLALIKQGFGEC